MDEPTTLLKPAEVAAHLRVNVRTVYRLINDGLLPRIYVGAGKGKATRIARADMDAYIKAMRRAGDAA
jgi:excisionase family DNA binding protein